MTMTVDDILAVYKFNLAGSCHCGNTLTLKYTYQKYLLKWQVKKNSFKLIHRNKLVKSLSPIHTLEETLDWFFPEIKKPG